MSQVLVLSKAYLPERIISQERALCMIFGSRVQNVIEHEDEILGKIPYKRIAEFKSTAKAYGRTFGDELGDLLIYSPSVIISKTRFYHFRREVGFTRSNVYKRDRFKCQYCGRERTVNDLNYDHVIPRSFGGKTSWDNIVTCCYACNIRKGNRTPEEADMALLKKPLRPTWQDILFHDLANNSIEKRWVDYIKHPG